MTLQRKEAERKARGKESLAAVEGEDQRMIQNKYLLFLSSAAHRGASPVGSCSLPNPGLSSPGDGRSPHQVMDALFTR